MNTKDGFGTIQRIQGGLYLWSYIDIIDKLLVSYVIDGTFINGHFLLQQHFSPVHTAHVVKIHLEDFGKMTLPYYASLDDQDENA